MIQKKFLHKNIYFKRKNTPQKKFRAKIKQPWDPRGFTSLQKGENHLKDSQKKLPRQIKESWDSDFLGHFFLIQENESLNHYRKLWFFLGFQPSSDFFSF